MSSDFKQDLDYYVILAAFLLWPTVLFVYISIMEHYEAVSENSDNITISEGNNNHFKVLSLGDNVSF